MSKSITREELKRRLGAGEPFVLVEALPAKYFDHAHIPGAIRLNWDEVDRASQVLPDRSAPVVTYCAHETCENSHKLAAALESQGYADVAVYTGGKKDWIDAGLPVEKTREAA
ncbi:MAG TPA: rhodanese-like domain-containing protein [Caulobacteraceae bacterium]|nr:rhodanese-like domain-containing protein [Caulobacteraceae bacterium]